ncbi:MAG TPA: SMI1/KNR4 family protein [Polyangiaceae bacterium]
MSQFHQASFELAGWVPASSAAAEAEVLRLEQRLGVRLPQAFRELLASDAWPGFLQAFSDGDEPIEPARMPLDERQTPETVEHRRRLVFMLENQGVCAWAIDLGEDPDPEVQVEVDSGDPPTWQACAEHFSTWLYCQVFDRKLLESAMFAAQAEPLAPAVLRELGASMMEGPRTRAWPGRENIRLRCELGEVLLWSGDDQCDWWIAPRSPDTATALLDRLRLSAAFEAWLYPLRDAGREALQRWASRRAP